jgi:hypothetical protein
MLISRSYTASPPLRLHRCAVGRLYLLFMRLKLRTRRLRSPGILGAHLPSAAAVSAAHQASQVAHLSFVTTLEDHSTLPWFLQLQSI